MAIRLPLLFNFNQHVNEYALTASRACYRGLLRVLRSHPNIPVNIQISGTLIRALQWLDPEPLQLIWEGLRAGQFELLGSTYAQNVPYASNDWDNARQIELHLEVLHETFGVTPVTFWNPERSWRQSLLPVIASAGYRFTLVEDHILAKARLAEPVVVTSQVGAHILTLLYDDHLLRDMFNFAVWFGRPGQLQSYLIQRARHPNASNHLFTYAEDAEAMGLWSWQNGIVPNQTWHRLDQVLTLLEALPHVELIHLTNAPASAGNLSPIPDGSALWMDDSLEDAERPYHEPGYDNWFDFNENSPKLATFREFFGEIRDALQALGEELDKGAKKHWAARALYKAALHNYLSHQYEFGCIGIGGKGYRGWEGARASWVLIQAARWAVDPEPFAVQIDINHDGYEELVLCDGKQLIVTTPAGGRLLYWFDLTSGREYVGNQRAVTQAPYEADALLPEWEPVPFDLWLPDDYRPQAIVAEAQLTAEAAPTRMGKYLPDWIWEGEREPFELLTREIREPGTHWPLPAQRRGFVDFVHADGEAPAPGARLEGKVEDSIVYTRLAMDGVTMTKRYTLDAKAIVVTYEWYNEMDEERELSWWVVNELCPAYEQLLEQGRKGVHFVRDAERPGVRNKAAKEDVRVEADQLPTAVAYEDALLALEIHHEFRLVLAPGSRETVTIRLVREEAQRSK